VSPPSDITTTAHAAAATHARRSDDGLQAVLLAASLGGAGGPRQQLMEEAAILALDLGAAWAGHAGRRVMRRWQWPLLTGSTNATQVIGSTGFSMGCREMSGEIGVVAPDFWTPDLCSGNSSRLPCGTLELPVAWCHGTSRARDPLG
jgi:hypothetical protein